MSRHQHDHAHQPKEFNQRPSSSSLIASMNSKTPSSLRSRSEVKAPLTPSLVSALKSISITSAPKHAPTRSITQKPPSAPTKSKSTPTTAPFDSTNPFIVPPTSTRKPTQPQSRSRPASPVKRLQSGGIVVSESLQRQAGGGVIRKGGVESRLDVVTRDYVPPPKHEIKRSRSTPAASRDQRDRFITPRQDSADSIAATFDKMTINHQSASPGHTARLIEATGIPLNRRVLGYHEQPPSASSSITDPSLAQQREYARPLYARPAPIASSSTSSTTSKSRRISSDPIRVLDAPGILEDFYLNILSWSCLNQVAVALAETTYIWSADTGSVARLGEAPDESYVSAVDFSNDGMFLGVGIGTGDVELWDVETGQKLRTMAGHQGKIPSLTWYQHILTSGCEDGSIWHHDVRVPRHKVMELVGHTGEVCGLKWRSDGELLASGANDNVVNIWDGRVGDVGEGARGTAKWTKRNHTAAVKAIAWCPWQPSLLASGGGTHDATINIWNTNTGARLHTLQTPAQITSIQWCPHLKELLTTHGYPTNALMVHAYPSMEKVAEIRDAHDMRVLFSAIGPAGDTVVTGAGDENLKFWKVWDLGSGSAKKKKERMEERRPGLSSTKSGILSIR